MLPRLFSLLRSAPSFCTLCVTGLLLSCKTHATEGKTAAVAASTESAPDLAASALQMVVGLLGVLALLLAALWLLKRLSQPRGPLGGLMRVVAGVAVGTRERVVILELGNSWLILGVAPGQITTLAEIPRQELSGTPTSPAPATDFSRWLQRFTAHREQEKR